MRGPIYEPRGAAREYAELALNIYTGCTHGCSYCYAPQILRRSRGDFAACVRPREGLFFDLERQLARGDFGGRTVHLCFTCDPYPCDVDHTRTRDVIGLLKDAGCHVQVLTKNPTAALLDLDLLDGSDTVGTTVTGGGSFFEPGSPAESRRLDALMRVKRLGIGTWVSCEPILDAGAVMRAVERCDFVDRWSFGKLNHAKTSADWGAIGRDIESACRQLGRSCVIKDSLRKEMEETRW